MRLTTPNKCQIITNYQNVERPILLTDNVVEKCWQMKCVPNDNSFLRKSPDGVSDHDRKWQPGHQFGKLS